MSVEGTVAWISREVVWKSFLRTCMHLSNGIIGGLDRSSSLTDRSPCNIASNSAMISTGVDGKVVSSLGLNLFAGFGFILASGGGMCLAGALAAFLGSSWAVGGGVVRSQ